LATTYPPSLQKVAISLQGRPEKMIIPAFFSKSEMATAPKKLAILLDPIGKRGHPWFLMSAAFNADSC
jgi:hypothetical protein